MKDQKIGALKSAMKELISEGGGSKPAFKEVYLKAGVERATAYRVFKEEFDRTIARIGETGDRVAKGDAQPTDTRSAYRKLTAKLANRVQVLELELEHEKSRRKAESGVAVPFPTNRQ